MCHLNDEIVHASITAAFSANGKSPITHRSLRGWVLDDLCADGYEDDEWQIVEDYISYLYDEGQIEKVPTGYEPTDLFLWPEDLESEISTSPNVNLSVAVNDYVCPTCKNDRCSKREKICWRCGHNL